MTSSETFVAIIGSAKPDNWNKESFKKMIKICVDFIQSIKNICQVFLVSGGSSWCDHIAVYLYINKERFDIPIKGLILHIPCPFNEKFLDNGSYHWSVNPGKTLNTFHQSFSKKINRDSFKDIQKAISLGTIVIVSNGFHQRNKKIAEKADYLIAFGENDEPTSGTKHTYSLAKCYKEYVKI
jgi:hypothetical protein